jgi:hypothetical protein
MFEEHQNNRQISLAPPAITIACSMVGALLSIGLCGLSGENFLESRAHPVLVQIGVILFFLSIIGFVVGVVWLLATAISSYFR